MIIEFIGSPGAGKTTLLPTVIECLRIQAVRGYTVVEAARPFARRTILGKGVERLLPSGWHRPVLWQLFYYLSFLSRLKFFVQYPDLIRQVSSSQRRRPIPRVERRHTTYWFYHLVGYYAFLTTHARPAEALILDEGFIHRVVQLNASDREELAPARIKAYVNLVPRPDLVIFVRAGRDTCEKRIYRRGLWDRFSHKSPAEVARYVANAHAIVALTTDYIRSQGWLVIEVDNSSDEPALAKVELQRKLREISFLACEMPLSEKV